MTRTRPSLSHIHSPAMQPSSSTTGSSRRQQREVSSSLAYLHIYIYLNIYTTTDYTTIDRYLHIYTGQQQPHFPWLESMGGAGAGYTAATGHLHQHTNTYCEQIKREYRLLRFILWISMIYFKRNKICSFYSVLISSSKYSWLDDSSVSFAPLCSVFTCV